MHYVLVVQMTQPSSSLPTRKPKGEKAQLAGDKTSAEEQVALTAIYPSFRNLEETEVPSARIMRTYVLGWLKLTLGLNEVGFRWVEMMTDEFQAGGTSWKQ